MSVVAQVPRRPTVLVILDGFGINSSRLNNGVSEASTPVLDDYFSRYPHTTLAASGRAVGLPDGQMGNSEVGHLTLGAGSVIRQDIVRISDSVASGDFQQVPALTAAMQRAAGADRRLHLIGLVSDGGVHSDMGHLEALIRMTREHGVTPQLHMITDGRDTPPQSALHYLQDVESLLHEAGGTVGSVVGRYYAMDRDKRWDRTELAWRLLTLGKGEKSYSAETGIRAAYSAGDTDEFIRPLRTDGFEPVCPGDEVIFFNFRKDRPRQLVAALADPAFAGFDRGSYPEVSVTCMMPYDRNLELPFAFEPERPKITLGEVISATGLAQFHCAETEKYAHVTYFFNGGRTTPYSGENQLLVPSPRVATYDLKPEMSASDVADAVVEAIHSKQYGFIVVNFANGDMVGHTAKREAVLAAVETLDREAGRVLKAAETDGYSVVLTADHGNCEEMVDPYTGGPHTQHTTYPVPCLIVDGVNWQLSCGGGLANIAPTVLQLMGLAVPEEMAASSLLLRELPGRRPEERNLPRELQGAA